MVMFEPTIGRTFGRGSEVGKNKSNSSDRDGGDCAANGSGVDSSGCGGTINKTIISASSSITTNNTSIPTNIGTSDDIFRTFSENFQKPSVSADRPSDDNDGNINLTSTTTTTNTTTIAPSTNTPSTMVTDQFGMIGFLAFLKAAETDPNLASVTFGTDLTQLGLNLTAAEKLYPSFAGPWSDQPLKVYEIDYPVPSEYLVNSSIRDRLTQISLKNYHEDTIFFLFYMYPNDMLQVAAALELYSREWRYHKEEKVWITRAPGINPSEKTSSYERGTYYIFDAQLWRRVPRDFMIEYDLLESTSSL